MFNRLNAVLYIEYMFDHINDLDYKKYYEYMYNDTNNEFPDNIQEEVEKAYYRILLNPKNKSIPLLEQIDIVLENYKKYKEYLNDNNLNNKCIIARTSLMDFEFKVVVEYLKSRNMVRKLRKGYK